MVAEPLGYGDLLGRVSGGEPCAEAVLCSAALYADADRGAVLTEGDGGEIGAVEAGGADQIGLVLIDDAVGDGVREDEVDVAGLSRVRRLSDHGLAGLLKADGVSGESTGGGMGGLAQLRAYARAFEVDSTDGAEEPADRLGLEVGSVGLPIGELRSIDGVAEPWHVEPDEHQRQWLGVFYDAGLADEA